MADLRYNDSHEWHKLEGESVTLGLSRFAIDELTDVTFIELPEVGEQVDAGSAIGEVESVKATSEIYTGVSGKVTAVNEEVVEDPSILNEDPYEKGWLLKIEPADPSELDNLMDGEAYEKKYPSS